MTKVTLDETEYDTDDFTDLQKNMLSEINYNNNLQTQLSYTLQSVRTSADILLTKLKDNLTLKQNRSSTTWQHTENHSQVIFIASTMT